MEKYNNEQSKAYNKKLEKLLAGGVHYNFRTYSKEEPRHYVRGNGARVWDKDGNEYLDLYAKFGANLLGHNHPEYIENFQSRLSSAISINLSDLDLEVAELINECVPSIELIRFGLSGTEVIQNAMRAARAHTKKNKFIRFIGHYHGNADNIMGGTGESKSEFLPTEFMGDPRGTSGRADNILVDQSFILPWNDFEALEEVVEAHKDELAAIITEPICIDGGGIYPVKGYLERMRELCDQHNIVLIFDEIITGFRVHIGGAQTLLGVTPDLTVMGKAMGGGALPVSLFGGKREIMEHFEEQKVVHAGTFNGYVLGSTAVISTLSILKKNNFEAYANMTKYGNMLKEVFLQKAKENGIDLVIQGHEHAMSYHSMKEPLLDSRDRTYEIALKNGIIKETLANYGILISPISRMFMNIQFNESDIDFFAQHIDAGLKESAKIIDEIYATA